MMRLASTLAVAAVLLFTAGCAEFQSSTPFSPYHPERVRRQMIDLVNRNQFQKAREVPVKKDLAGGKSPEEKMREQLIETLVNPAEAKYTVARILAMKAQVSENLEKNDDDAARQAIYQLGITDQKAVNTVVYIAKCHYLNTMVNPATLAKWERFSKRYVDGSIESGEYGKALAAARKIAPVAAYPERIDELLEAAGEGAVAQHADAAGVDIVDQLAQSFFYGIMATRDGGEREPLGELEHALQARTEKLMPGEKFVPDWTETELRLERLKEALLASDVEEEDADEIAETLLAAYQGLFAEDRGLTTFALNLKLSALRQLSLYRVAKAIDGAVQAAEGARAGELRKLAMAAAALIAEEVDSMDRERAMLAAISDRAEPDLNRMLGEGCRALRLYRTNGKVSRAQATSLFVAAVYMGFDDLMDLALALGADVNGASEKDELGRTAYLLALQYGFRGRAREVLASANAAKRDAKGYGAVHYAVRGGDAAVLLSLLQRGLDGKKAADDGTTPLMLAVARGNGKMARMLLGLSDVEAADARGYTALHHAAARGDLDLVQALAGAKASLDKKTAEGDTVVSLAVRSNSEALMAYLLDDLKLPADERAVSRCVIEGWLWPLKTLVAHGGELTDGHLAAAVKCGQIAVVKWLVERGFDVNAPVVRGVPCGSQEIADYLFAQGYRK